MNKDIEKLNTIHSTQFNDFCPICGRPAKFVRSYDMCHLEQEYIKCNKCGIVDLGEDYEEE